MARITSSVASKQFGRVTKLALRDNVVEVTNHGQVEVMVVSATEYRRLKSLDRQVLTAQELPVEIVEGVRAAKTPPEAAGFDHEKPVERTE